MAVRDDETGGWNVSNRQFVFYYFVKTHLVSGFHGRFSVQGTEYKEIYKS